MAVGRVPLSKLLDGNVTRLENLRRENNSDDVDETSRRIINSAPDLATPLRIQLDQMIIYLGDRHEMQRSPGSSSPPVREGDLARVYVLEATIEILKAENEILTRRLAAAEAWAAQETAKAEGAIAELSALTRLRVRVAAL